jgi:DNA-binding response OmpR family regulator
MNQSIRVLIVDDEERFRETTAAILERRGFEVKAVGSGIEAIEEIKNNKIDVVVLDQKMPGMDGNEVLCEIKELRPAMAVLMLTGHGTPETALQGLRDGLFDYLTKPCDVDFLAQKIREAHAREIGVSGKEPNVKQAMVPLSSFASIREDQAVAHAAGAILEGFTHILTTSTVQETVHRSILVQDKEGSVVGIITFSDLLQGLQPPYMRLLAERPAMADSIHLESPNFSGMFTVMARDLATKTVRDIMPDIPPVIDAGANLMEAATKCLNMSLRRLLVTENDRIVGVIREQDLFFEMVKILTQHGRPSEGR